ncbi:hypothetical protein KQI89_15430 [Clostridium sp. MSJ-4]|uniref:Lipoprotein n=1 Tax=Clostridium simiarum TaxID=2841506 RepID=A0ABS6F407_9CLOT|nr:hypothetical protein [Clostridium simiarum]MBU5593140.1 hypothetical protein [Clostridium simiarum]
MKTEMRKELKIGWGAFTISLILNCFFDVPKMVMGILMGLSISFFIVGALQERVYQGLKHRKKSFVENTLSKKS